MPSGENDGGLVRAAVARERFRLAARCVDDVETVDQLGVPALVAQAVEDELLAVGGPGRGAVLEVAARQLRRVAAVDSDDEDVLVAVARPADAVELMEDAREAPRLALAVVLFVIGGVANARREGDARRVG